MHLDKSESTQKSLHFNPGIVDAVIDADTSVGRANQLQGEATAVEEALDLRQFVCMAKRVGRNAVLKKDRDITDTWQQ